MFPRRRCLVFHLPLRPPEEAESRVEYRLPRPIGTSRAESVADQLPRLLPFLIDPRDTLTVGKLNL